VPLGLKAWFAGVGIGAVTELDWWDAVKHRGPHVTLTPVQHWSSRTPWDRDKTLWGGWVVEHPQLRFFFAGDTGYSRDFKDIGARLGYIDLAALPIGAYDPRWFMQIMHVNPEEAVQIHQDLRARHSVAMHWGTFILTDEPLDEPPHRLDCGAPGSRRGAGSLLRDEAWRDTASGRHAASTAGGRERRNYDVMKCGWNLLEPKPSTQRRKDAKETRDDYSQGTVLLVHQDNYPTHFAFVLICSPLRLCAFASKV
jgi:hypothetical protein